jgi:hypothetical protein
VVSGAVLGVDDAAGDVWIPAVFRETGAGVTGVSFRRVRHRPPASWQDVVCREICLAWAMCEKIRFLLNDELLVNETMTALHEN